MGRQQPARPPTSHPTPPISLVYPQVPLVLPTTTSAVCPPWLTEAFRMSTSPLRTLCAGGGGGSQHLHPPALLPHHTSSTSCLSPETP